MTGTSFTSFSLVNSLTVPDLIGPSSPSDNGETELSDSSLSEDDAPFLVSSSESSDDDSRVSVGMVNT